MDQIYTLSLGMKGAVIYDPVDTPDGPIETDPPIPG